MVVFHGGCSGGGQTQAAVPQTSVSAVGYSETCTSDEQAFEGGQTYAGAPNDVLCLPNKTIALYGEPYRGKRHHRGRLCRGAGDPSCGSGACQPFPERDYGFCLK
jgi:hypothetical protein